jgi:16S rRNA (uracil1498-N3)-methyltransferase
VLSLYLVSPEIQLVAGNRLKISDGEAHHIGVVARHKSGDEIWISNGRGERARAVIRELNGASKSGVEEVTVELLEVKNFPPREIRLRVLQALTKSDRAHECIELLVEAGVDEIIPWQSKRSIGKWQEGSTREKWQEWARQAVKQSRRSWIPEIGELVKDLNELPSDEDSLLLLFDEAGNKSLTDQIISKDRLRGITVIIGPEGGITEEEKQSFLERGALEVRLGEPILRSAHAGAIALAAIQSALEIWQ